MSDLIFSKLSSDRIFLKVYHPLTESHLVVGTKVKSLCEAESSELPVTEKKIPKDVKYCPVGEFASNGQPLYLSQHFLECTYILPHFYISTVGRHKPTGTINIEVYQCIAVECGIVALRGVRGTADVDFQILYITLPL